ncbi:MAG: Ig-like domain-containing protein [Bacteroidaceae bacterium]|nr:Ig-like domain-containing protein [Bacteroidaceae bacterium]
MKKILFTLLTFVGFSSAIAEDYDYPYLTIVTSGGTVKSVAASSLVLTISNGQLVAVNGDGNQTFTLSALSKMYFSKTNETATGTQLANGLAFSASETTATLGEDFTEPTLTNPYELPLTWSSSDEAVATVDEDGEVTLVAAGTATITASYAGSDDYVAGAVSYTLTVAKPDPVANGLAFNASEATATLGEDFTEPTLTNPYELPLTWSSSDEAVATVDEDGEVTLVAAGTTTITASYAGSDDYVAGAVSYTLTIDKTDTIFDLFAGSEVDVYSLTGSYIGRYATIAQARAQLKHGLYVIRSNHKSFKLSIK